MWGDDNSPRHQRSVHQSMHGKGVWYESWSCVSSQSNGRTRWTVSILRQDFSTNQINRIYGKEFSHFNWFNAKIIISKIYLWTHLHLSCNLIRKCILFCMHEFYTSTKQTTGLHFVREYVLLNHSIISFAFLPTRVFLF